MTTKVVKGTLWTLVGLTVPIFFSLFATPIVTRLLGAESYGLFVLLLLIPSYLSFADLGMNIASTKFASGAFAENSPDSEALIVRTAAFIAFASSLPIAAAMAFFSPLIVSVLNIPDHLQGEASICLKLVSVAFVINFLNNVFNTPQLSRLRMDLNISIFSGVRLAGIIATPIVIYLGGGVIGAVVVAVAVSVLTLTGHLIVSARLLPELVGSSIDRESIRPLLRFGGPMALAGIAAVLLTNLEKLVLTKVTSVETLAYYSIAVTFAAMLTLFSSSIVQSLMPAFSQLQGEKDRPALNALYSRGIRLTLVWLVPSVAFMVLVGKPFFTYWFGEAFGRESTGPFYVTIVGLFFNVLAYFPYSALMAAGRSDIFAKLYWLELLPYAFLVWWLASVFGAAGAAAAWSIRVIVDSSMLFFLAHRIGVHFAHGRKAIFAGSVLLMLLPIAALAYVGEVNITILLIAFVSGIFYCVIIWVFVLQKEEIRWLRASLERLVSREASG